MRVKQMAAALVMGCSVALGSWAVEDRQDILIEWEGIAVTAEDLERYIAYHLPDEDPAIIFRKPGYIDQYIQSILMLRHMARDAEKISAGPTAEQMAWQLEFQRVSWLAGALQQAEIMKAQEGMDWEALAREVYIAEPDKFTLPAKIDAAHILIKTDERTDAEAQALIASIHARVLKGEDFTALAQEFSDDPSVSKNGGELGTFDQRAMVPEFSAAAFALSEPGDISEPVKTKFGYHIIKLNRHLDGGRHPFALVKNNIVAELKKKEVGMTRANIVGSLRTETLSATMNVEAMNTFRAKYGLKPLPKVDAPVSEAE